MVRPGQQIRFILHPGNVRSLKDGDVHFIGAPQLASLHGLRVEDCIVVDPNSGYFKNKSGDIHLRPNEKGHYPRYR